MYFVNDLLSQSPIENASGQKSWVNDVQWDLFKQFAKHRGTIHTSTNGTFRPEARERVRKHTAR